MSETNPHQAKVENVEPIPEEVQQAARMTVCRFATDAEEARELLAMLGLLSADEDEIEAPPEQSEPVPESAVVHGPCKTCGCMTYKKHVGRIPVGGRRHFANGECSSCYHRRRRAEYSTLVDAGPVIAWIRTLQAGGRSLAGIARESGLGRDTIRDVVGGKVRRVRRETAEKIQALTLPAGVR